jgi:hypothetical protein
MSGHVTARSLLRNEWKLKFSRDSQDAFKELFKGFGGAQKYWKQREPINL